MHLNMLCGSYNINNDPQNNLLLKSERQMTQRRISEARMIIGK
jgi:hypothetical protein